MLWTALLSVFIYIIGWQWGSLLQKRRDDYLNFIGLRFNMLEDKRNNISADLVGGAFGCYDIDFIQKVHSALWEKCLNQNHSSIMKKQGRSSLIEHTRGRESDVPWGVRLSGGTAILSVSQGRQLVIRGRLNVMRTTFCRSRLQQHLKATSMTSWNIAERVRWILNLIPEGIWEILFLTPMVST